jgi:hypothetical protein
MIFWWSPSRCVCAYDSFVPGKKGYHTSIPVYHTLHTLRLCADHTIIRHTRRGSSENHLRLYFRSWAPYSAIRIAWLSGTLPSQCQLTGPTIPVQQWQHCTRHLLASSAHEKSETKKPRDLDRTSHFAQKAACDFTPNKNHKTRTNMPSTQEEHTPPWGGTESVLVTPYTGPSRKWKTAKLSVFKPKPGYSRKHWAVQQFNKC